MAGYATESATASSAESAYHELRRLLVSGRFTPGERLREIDISQRLGVSRTPVREALRRLQSDGLVETGGRGAVVAGLATSQVSALYQFRAALEALTAELAARRNRAGELAPSQLAELNRARERVEAAAGTGDMRATTEANLDLHRLIAALSGNEFVIEALSRVWDKIAISSLTNLTDPRWVDEIHRHHRDIVEAIEGGEPRVAALTARRHVQQASDIYTAAHPDHATLEEGHHRATDR